MYKTKRLYHYSTSDNINNIVKSRSIWLTSFEKQKTELCYKPCRDGIFYASSFSLEQIDFAILEEKGFKGKLRIDSHLIIDMDDLNSFIDKDAG